METAITASLAGRYASALYALASERNALPALGEDITRLETALRESAELGALIRDPSIARDDAARGLAAVTELLALAPLTRDFLGVLAANRRLATLPAILAAYAAIAAQARGEVTAEVISAHPLSAEQTAALAAKLAAREGKKVELATRVDPGLLGGFVVRMGSREIDASIRTRLANLEHALGAQAASG